jgi:biotin--protein ligase
VKLAPAFYSESVVYIYNDCGVCEEGVRHFYGACEWSSVPFTLKTITADEVIRADWCSDAVAFIMPGGADLPYGEKLNGAGNAVIRSYVEKGGAYLGVCAGAYYGSGFCDFHRGDERGYQVLGSRELSFFTGSAIGPVLAPYVYNSEEGARIAHVKTEASEICASYYNGGCYFHMEDTTNMRVLAVYENDQAKGKPAIIECRVGEGRALLSGVHPEHPIDDPSHKKLFDMVFFQLLWSI